MTIRTRTLIAASLLGALTFACKSLGSEEDQQQAGGLWGEMAGYQEWGSFEGHAGMQPGKSPHGKFVRTFVNAAGMTDRAAPGFGTILVKENFASDDPASLQGLTVMQRIEGYDPENGDWFWARYTPAGELTHSGQVAFCADCHFDAKGDDFVFLND